MTTTLVAVLAACDRGAPASVALAGWTAAPAHADVAELCLDVGAARGCWGGTCGELGCLVPRPPADRLGPTRGVRCSGRGDARRCEARSNDASGFRCDGARCVQHIPRTPDTGEWQCVDLGGAVYCRNVVDAAGIPPGPLDPAWSCGTRRGHGERICVDFSPDTPDPHAAWKCGVSYAAGVAERVCQPTTEPRLGDACGDRALCPEGAGCVGGRCLPARPRPSCWLDGDCGDGGRCHFGSCLHAP